MNKEQFDMLAQLIDYIDDNIKQPLDLDEISAKFYISKFHLHRMFKSLTDKSLISYVRNRRLSLSLKELINTNLNVIDIATEYQFKYEQSYIRAFRNKFNITPAQYRKAKCEMEIEQKIDKNFLHYMGQGLMVEPRMCFIDKMIIQGICKEIVHEENLKKKTTNTLAECFLADYLPKMDNVIDKNIYIGFVKYSKDFFYSNFYLPSVIVSNKTAFSPDLVTIDIPANEYAVFRYIGFHSPHEIDYKMLFNIYHFIDEWKMKTSYAQADPYHFEKMDTRICTDNYCQMDIYVPIKTTK